MIDKKEDRWIVPFNPQSHLEEYRNGAGVRTNEGVALVDKRWMTVWAAPATLSSGVEVPDFYTYRRGDAVLGVVWCPSNRHFVMVRKIKTAAGIAYYGWPAGMLPKEKDATEHVLTEVREETGLTGVAVHALGYVHRSPEPNLDRDHLLLVEVENTNGMVGDPEEGTTPGVIHITDILSFCASQHVEPTSVVGLLRALKHIVTTRAEVTPNNFRI